MNVAARKMSREINIDERISIRVEFLKHHNLTSLYFGFVEQFMENTMEDLRKGIVLETATSENEAMPEGTLYA